MRNINFILAFFSALLISELAHGFATINDDETQMVTKSKNLLELNNDMHDKISERIYLAKKRKRVKKNRRPREKILSSEGLIRRTGDRTSVDFDSVDIFGSRKTPLGSVINRKGADMDYDFVKIRMRWHPEMINSASSLDTVVK